MTTGTRGRAPASSSPAPLLIHIGLHKTGSTWLQQAIFNDPGRGFTTEAGAPRHQLVHDFVLPDPLAYDATATRRLYDPYLETSVARRLTLVLSHERLSGYPSSGGYDRSLIAQRLRDTFPEARILIVIREQRALIRSMYSQHITDGGNGTLDQFLYRPERGIGRRPWFNFDMYRFDRLIDLYRSLFGADRVQVAAYETLNDDIQGFVDAISDFCGNPKVSVADSRPQNRRRVWAMQEVQRRLNTWFYDNELSPGAFLHVRRFAARFARSARYFRAIVPPAIDRRMHAALQRKVDRAVGDYFTRSNTMTAEMTGIDLNRIGYMTVEADHAEVRTQDSTAISADTPTPRSAPLSSRKNASMLATSRIHDEGGAR